MEKNENRCKNKGKNNNKSKNKNKDDHSFVDKSISELGFSELHGCLNPFRRRKRK